MQLFGRGGHICAEAPIKMVWPEQAVGVNKTPVGVNRSKAVSHAALFELFIPNLVHINLNIGAQGPWIQFTLIQS